MKTKLHMLPREKFPMTITLYSRFGARLWWRTVEEPRGLVALEVPGYGGTHHVPVRVVIEYGDGTSETL